MAHKYPQDRFDAPSALARVGVHRGPRRRRGRWLWLGWSALAVVVIVGAGWVGIRGLDSSVKNISGPDGSAAATSLGPSSGATPTLVASSPIGVLNGTGIANLADAGVQALNNAGWQNVDAASSSSTTITQTVIYYGSAADEGIALGVQQTFPKAQLVESTAYNDTDNVVTVVLGSDYKDLPIPATDSSQATGIPATPAE